MEVVNIIHIVFGVVVRVATLLGVIAIHALHPSRI